MAQVTAQGITGVSLNEYLSAIEAKLLNIDPAWNIDPDSPDGQKNGTDAETLANLDEALVAVYRSKDPASAIGESLNDIGAISGIPRQLATFSVAPVILTGVPTSIIPANVTVIRSRIDNTAWTLNSSVVIGSSGSGTGFVTCVTAGRISVMPGELTVIGTPTPGLSSVTNPLAATQGQAEETDAEYRIRRTESVSINGSNSLDNMTAKVGAVSTVTSVKVYENYLDTADINGIPGHSIAIVVNGGSDADVGLAISQKKNPGCGMFPRWNEQTETWIDTPGTNGVLVYVKSPVTGLENPFTFQRALALSIYVNIQIQRKGTLPSNIGQLIIQAVIADATKALFSGDTSIGFNQGGYDIGEVVPVGRLYTPVNKILGQYGDSYATSITIGTSSGSLGSATITPAYNQLATFDEDNIVVTVTA